jgi:hypothetical protein
MLAYVFWHWPRPGIASDEYEERQRVFHAALAERGPSALLRSYVWRVTGPSWTPVSVVWEDWYLLADSAGLDALNSAAISDPLREEHDAAASLAAGGMAALYAPAGPRAGQPFSLDGRYALWFHKPDDMRYTMLYQLMGAELPGLWVRMMTLGPAPELCLMTDDPHLLEPTWRAHVTRRERIWPLGNDEEEKSGMIGEPR